MNIKSAAINQFAKFMIGGIPFASMKRIVVSLANTDLTGEQKRESALTEFKTLGYSVATFMMNLAVELAVSWLKSQIKE